MAPVTRKKTMLDIFKVSRIEFIIPFHFSLRNGRVTKSVKKTPAAPASVGVKNPAYNPPMTRRKITTAGSQTSCSMSGIGTGVRMRLFNKALLRLEWGFPLGEDTVTESGHSAFYFSLDFNG